jgi:hypothetical protein
MDREHTDEEIADDGEENPGAHDEN